MSLAFEVYLLVGQYMRLLCLTEQGSAFLPFPRLSIPPLEDNSISLFNWLGFRQHTFKLAIL